jgi:hypothetical protein
MVTDKSNNVLIFASDKRFGLMCSRWRGMERNTTVATSPESIPFIGVDVMKLPHALPGTVNDIQFKT